MNDFLERQDPTWNADDFVRSADDTAFDGLMAVRDGLCSMGFRNTPARDIMTPKKVRWLTWLSFII
jgi:hypothetical protein